MNKLKTIFINYLCIFSAYNLLTAQLAPYINNKLLYCLYSNFITVYHIQIKSFVKYLPSENKMIKSVTVKIFVSSSTTFRLSFVVYINTASHPDIEGNMLVIITMSAQRHTAG